MCTASNKLNVKVFDIGEKREKPWFVLFEQVFLFTNKKSYESVDKQGHQSKLVYKRIGYLLF